MGETILENRQFPADFFSFMVEAGVNEDQLAVLLATYTENPVRRAEVLTLELGAPDLDDETRQDLVGQYIALLRTETVVSRPPVLEVQRQTLQDGLFGMFISSEVPSVTQDYLISTLADVVTVKRFAKFMDSAF